LANSVFFPPKAADGSNFLEVRECTQDGEIGSKIAVEYFGRQYTHNGRVLKSSIKDVKERRARLRSAQEENVYKRGE
jgi:hypothetical protein